MEIVGGWTVVGCVVGVAVVAVGVGVAVVVVGVGVAVVAVGVGVAVVVVGVGVAVVAVGVGVTVVAVGVGVGCRSCCSHSEIEVCFTIFCEWEVCPPGAFPNLIYLGRVVIDVECDGSPAL